MNWTCLHDCRQYGVQICSIGRAHPAIPITTLYSVIHAMALHRNTNTSISGCMIQSVNINWRAVNDAVSDNNMMWRYTWATLDGGSDARCFGRAAYRTDGPLGPADHSARQTAYRTDGPLGRRTMCQTDGRTTRPGRPVRPVRPRWAGGGAVYVAPDGR